MQQPSDCQVRHKVATEISVTMSCQLLQYRLCCFAEHTVCGTLLMSCDAVIQDLILCPVCARTECWQRTLSYLAHTGGATQC